MSAPATRPRIAAVAALAALPLAACNASPGAAPASLAGCYYFERDAVAERLRLPWGVRLLPDTLAGWPALQQRPGVRVARTLVGLGEEAGHPFGYWRTLHGDSLEIGYPAGGGLVLTLAVSGPRLAGEAVAAGDALPLGGVVPERRGEPVALLHAACPDASP
jgi:hypothetical protein